MSHETMEKPVSHKIETFGRSVEDAARDASMSSNKAGDWIRLSDAILKETSEMTEYVMKHVLRKRA